MSNRRGDRVSEYLGCLKVKLIENFLVGSDAETIFKIYILVMCEQVLTGYDVPTLAWRQ
jgi:hypothetical protein